MSPHLIRPWFACFAFVALVWSTLAGCGRTGLSQYDSLADGGGEGDASACSALTCPSGCCDAAGTCRAGTSLESCGSGGHACLDCVATGFESCNSELGACFTPQTTCNAATCANGCCSANGGQTGCVSGASDVACGATGQLCVSCSPGSCAADSRTCVAPPPPPPPPLFCDPSNCKGCCSGNSCLSGTSSSACGLSGAACSTCANVAPCNPSSGKCEAVSVVCNGSNCKGCCSGDTCVGGTLDAQCGLGGAKCQDCAATALTCQSSQCLKPQTKCTSQNCSGCCDVNNGCFAGFVDTRCGSSGAACADCTASNRQCDTGATPRVCSSIQTKCPAPYLSCGGGVTTSALVVSKSACSAADLADAKNACKSGFTTAACQNFFTTIAGVNAACSKCIAPFQYDFTAVTGIFNCVSPFVSATCNHNTGCVSDCVGQSCGACPQQNKAACETQVRGQGGQCLTYLQASGACVGQALFGQQAQFCSPQAYAGNYGNWLAGVGAHYCGP